MSVGKYIAPQVVRVDVGDHLHRAGFLPSWRESSEFDDQSSFFSSRKMKIQKYKKIGKQRVLSLKVGKAEQADLIYDLIFGIRSTQLEKMSWILRQKGKLLNLNINLKKIPVFINNIFAATSSFSSHTTGCWSSRNELNTSLHKPQQPWKSFFWSLDWENLVLNFLIGMYIHLKACTCLRALSEHLNIVGIFVCMP